MSEDLINKPKHYNSHPKGYECWDVVGPFGYFIGNAMKYLWRQGLKPGVENIQDLRKAIAFIEKEIKNMEEKKTIEFTGIPINNTYPECEGDMNKPYLPLDSVFVNVEVILQYTNKHQVPGLRFKTGHAEYELVKFWDSRRQWEVKLIDPSEPQNAATLHP
jgi:hypothetical protein